MAKNQSPSTEPISDAEFFRLHMLYLERKDPHRRPLERAKAQLNLVAPSEHGNQVVDYKIFREMVAAGKAKEPVKGYR